ncbi:MAG: hypothetical protein ACQESR_27970 [Planctomycetota bacterium]
MESCPTQAVLPLVGLAAEKVIRERYNNPSALISGSFVFVIPTFLWFAFVAA